MYVHGVLDSVCCLTVQLVRKTVFWGKKITPLLCLFPHFYICVVTMNDAFFPKEI